MRSKLHFHRHIAFLSDNIPNIIMLVILPLIFTLISLSECLTVVSKACAKCNAPTFPPGGRVLYLPHCVNGNSMNYCDAVCSGTPVCAS